MYFFFFNGHVLHVSLKHGISANPANELDFEALEAFLCTVLKTSGRKVFPSCSRSKGRFLIRTTANFLHDRKKAPGGGGGGKFEKFINHA